MTRHKSKRPSASEPADQDDPAGRGPLGRRAFLSGGLAAGTTAAGLLAVNPARAADPANQPPTVPEWSQYLGANVEDAPYGVPSPFEAGVVRRNVRWLTATTESSVNFTPLHALDGIVTPNGLCFERHHSGVATVDPEDHRLMIHGLVERPLIFTMQDLKRFPRMSRFYFLECAANGGMEWRGAQLNSCQFTHGMVHCVQYSGVSLRTVLESAGVKAKAKWLLVEGADAAAMTRSIPLDKALDDCMIAFSMNGEALRPEQGYPLRLVVPGFEGNMWVKWLRRIEVGDQPWHTREETSKYTDLLADGRARRFTWAMDAKSVITSPCPERPMMHKGPNVISGLAWSGRGRIEQVDISLDGGRNWTAARLEQPVLPMCLTRFYYEWEWRGGSVLLESRARDETGYVQPTIAQLRNVRGTNSIYHNNRIQTWLVNPSGEVENVQVS
jgi:sulfane dehydrogenase subunit SoxC